jgi:hypothetical protein
MLQRKLRLVKTVPKLKALSCIEQIRNAAIVMPLFSLFLYVLRATYTRLFVLSVSQNIPNRCILYYIYIGLPVFIVCHAKNSFGLDPSPDVAGSLQKYVEISRLLTWTQTCPAHVWMLQA